VCVLAELVASPAAEQRQHNGCIVKRIAQAARENPARVFAVLAGIAFICLLGTFVAQVVLTIVCGVSIISDITMSSHGPCMRGQICINMEALQQELAATVC
jgi:hypothetical protein